MLTIDEVGTRCERVLDEIERAVIGKRKALELVLLGLLADGNVLLEDYPGLAKTLAARSFARATTLGFARIQFTPDLMPSDVTGSSIFNQRTADFEFRPGPIFTNLLLADEINRAPPKTQAALLEAMQERQVTIEGTTYPLDRPFIVLATQNPIEYEGTYPLPEAQLDRFLLRIGIGYPTPDDEWRMVERRVERGVDEVEVEPVVDGPTLLQLQGALEQVYVSESIGRYMVELRIGIGYPTPDDEWRMVERRVERGVDEVEVEPVVDGPTLLQLQGALEQVYVSESIGRYMVELVTATRTSPRVQVGASPRGTLALLKLARGHAALAGRDFVTPDDVKAIAVPALAHRLTLRPELWVQRIRGEDIVRESLEAVPTPPAEDVARAAIA